MKAMNALILLAGAELFLRDPDAFGRMKNVADQPANVHRCILKGEDRKIEDVKTKLLSDNDTIITREDPVSGGKTIYLIKVVRGKEKKTEQRDAISKICEANGVTLVKPVPRIAHTRRHVHNRKKVKYLGVGRQNIKPILLEGVYNGEDVVVPVSLEPGETTITEGHVLAQVCTDLAAHITAAVEEYMRTSKFFRVYGHNHWVTFPIRFDLEDDGAGHVMAEVRLAPVKLLQMPHYRVTSRNNVVRMLPMDRTLMTSSAYVQATLCSKQIQKLNRKVFKLYTKKKMDNKNFKADVPSRALQIFTPGTPVTASTLVHALEEIHYCMATDEDVHVADLHALRDELLKLIEINARCSLEFPFSGLRQEADDEFTGSSWARDVLMKKDSERLLEIYAIIEAMAKLTVANDFAQIHSECLQAYFRKPRQIIAKKVACRGAKYRKCTTCTGKMEREPMKSAQVTQIEDDYGITIAVAVRERREEKKEKELEAAKSKLRMSALGFEPIRPQVQMTLMLRRLRNRFLYRKTFKFNDDSVENRKVLASWYNLYFVALAWCVISLAQARGLHRRAVQRSPRLCRNLRRYCRHPVRLGLLGLGGCVKRFKAAYTAVSD